MRRELLQHIEPGQDEETLLKLRVMVETMSLVTLRQLNSLLLGGHFTHLNRTQWLEVVQDSFNQMPPRFTQSLYKLQVVLGSGQVLLDQDVVLYASGSCPLPVDCLAGMYVQVLPERGTSISVTSEHAGY